VGSVETRPADTARSRGCHVRQRQKCRRLGCNQGATSDEKGLVESAFALGKARSVIAVCPALCIVWSSIVPTQRWILSRMRRMPLFGGTASVKPNGLIC
jgi:hypothetical protein